MPRVSLDFGGRFTHLITWSSKRQDAKTTQVLTTNVFEVAVRDVYSVRVHLESETDDEAATTRQGQSLNRSQP